jgi:hypothetical protein
LKKISVNFGVTDILLIRFSAFVSYWREGDGSTMRQYLSYTYLKKAYDSAKREALYNIPKVSNTHEIS